MDISDFHLVGPDIGMPVALHYALRGDCRAKSLVIGDGPCVSPTFNGSIIDRMVDSALWRLITLNAVHVPMEATADYEARFPNINNPKRRTLAEITTKPANSNPLIQSTALWYASPTEVHSPEEQS